MKFFKIDGRARGVMIAGLESIPESNFHYFSEIDDSDSNSSKNRILHCTVIDSGYWNRFQNQIFIMVMIPIPAKNGMITPLIDGIALNHPNCSKLSQIASLNLI